MRCIYSLSRRRIGLTSFSSFQRTVYNPGSAVFQGGLIKGEDTYESRR
ncbi:hypothetical protein D1BOALGB6SA_8244 [Olavius sp. associated proteobacterium Delta 1]|nr:hypothetical protein D1BOALGB6SA_8244 [Olavius sp. associated proteobacterium Delta 1]